MPSMTLQRKAMVLVVVTIGVLTALSAWLSRNTISASFDSLEQEQVRVEGERARRLLNQQLSNLAATVMDYAYWADTVAFVQGRQPDYFNDNFGAENLKYLRITQVMLLDADGRPVQGGELGEGDDLKPVSPDMVQALRSLAVPVLADTGSRFVLRTYHRSGGALHLIAMAAVRSQFEPGSPPKGALAIVRRFDTAELERYSDILMLPARLRFPEPGVTPVSSQAAGSRGDSLEAIAPLTDLNGQLVAEIVLTLPGELHRKGLALALAAATQVALAGIAIGALLIYLLHRVLLRRLEDVHQGLAAVSEQGLDGDALLPVRGDDELAALSRGINSLVVRVRADAVQQRESHARQEALHLQLLQSQKTESLGRFTGGIAHDFNNSLAAITGWMLLAKEDLSPGHPSVASIEKALESLRYGSALMRQLLSFGRQVAPRVERLRLGALVQETCDLVSLGLMKRCTLVVRCDTDEDWVRADPTQIKQVIVNLLINASDAMNGQGMITLSVDARHLSEEAPPGDLSGLPAGRYVGLTVRDSGPGIAPEHLTRIFEPFFTTKPQDRGTGLGLSVVQGIIARHHGRVTARSEPGEGACFEILLPEDRVSGPVPRSPETLPSAPSQRLLFVEDDEAIRTAWSTLLERQGWKVTQAGDGEEAWNRYRAVPDGWDLVLTDLSMPRLSGLELARRISSSGRPPPLVLISANTSQLDAEELHLAGFSAVLHKPVEQDRLLEALSNAIAIGKGAQRT